MVVTLKHVAAHAGVSRPTANLILIGKGDRFSASTREKVLAAAKALNYRPNLGARGLSQRRSFLIGVLVSHEYAAHYAEFSTCIQQVVLSRGCLPVTALSHNASSQRAMLARLIEARADAVVITREWNDDDGELAKHIDQAIGNGMTIIDMFADTPTAGAAASVNLDWDEAGRLAFVTMTGLGLKRLAFWTPLLPKTGGKIEGLEEKHLQWRGWKRAAESAGVDARLRVHALQPLRTTDAPRRDSPLYAAAAELMDAAAPPDGVFACSSNAAAHLSLYLDDHPEKKPRHFTITHWGDAFAQRDQRERRVILRMPVEQLVNAAAAAAGAAIANEPARSASIGPTLAIEEFTPTRSRAG